MMEIGEIEGIGESSAYQFKRYELGSLKMDVLKAKSSIFLASLAQYRESAWIGDVTIVGWRNLTPLVNSWICGDSRCER